MCLPKHAERLLLLFFPILFSEITEQQSCWCGAYVSRRYSCHAKMFYRLVKLVDNIWCLQGVVNGHLCTIFFAAASTDCVCTRLFLSFFTCHQSAACVHTYSGNYFLSKIFRFFLLKKNFFCCLLFVKINNASEMKRN